MLPKINVHCYERNGTVLKFVLFFSLNKGILGLESIFVEENRKKICLKKKKIILLPI